MRSVPRELGAPAELGNHYDFFVMNNFYIPVLDCILQVLNMYANDGQRLLEGVTALAHTASGPLMLIAGTACAIALIGAWALIGFVVLLFIIVLKVRNQRQLIDRRSKREVRKQQ